MPTSLTTPLPSIHPVYDPLIASLQDGADLASAHEGQSQEKVQLEVEDILESEFLMNQGPSTLIFKGNILGGRTSIQKLGNSERNKVFEG